MTAATVPTPLRRQAQLEAVLFVAVAVLLTVPFWLTDLDIQAAGVFYHPESPQNLWPEERLGIWQFFYKAIPILVNILLLACLSVLAMAGRGSSPKRTRRMAVFVLFSILLGPGLVVNGIFKDHYGRPRPRQIEQFQGQLQYQPPGLPGAEGKSFPCGHCSIGYIFWVFYFITRRKKPALATLLLLASISFGLVVGVGRMTAGGHFLSDILWSGLLSYAVCALLYYPLLGKWERSDEADVPEFFLFSAWQKLPAKSKPWLFAGVAVLVSVGALLATPYKTQQQLDLPLAEAAQSPLKLDIAYGDVLIRHSDSITAPQLRWQFKGFGFPSSAVNGQFDAAQRQFALSASGVFTDIEGQLELLLPTAFADGLVINSQRGRIVLHNPPLAHWQLTAAKGVSQATVKKP
jgi:lipid A 4'-phosphatase